MRVLIVGCGYVGLPLGAELVRQGHEVFGLRRSSAAESELTAAGIGPFYADITQAGDLARLPRDFDWVVNCVAAGGGSLEDHRRVYLQGTHNLINWLIPKPPQKYIYTSSTGVYGQNDGSLVTENDPTAPTGETGQVLVETEKLLLNAKAKEKFPAVVLRLAGIYGPDRGYWLQQFLHGEARIEGRGDRFLNMVHREDAVGAIIAALGNARAGDVFNVVDNEPVSQLKVFEWLSERLGKPLPPVVPESSPAARRRGVTNKQVSNSKLREELGYEFKYPTFRGGYEAELARLEKLRL
jgi:nucleoside-diphosphate-sugar epimerase